MNITFWFLSKHYNASILLTIVIPQLGWRGGDGGGGGVGPSYEREGGKVDEGAKLNLQTTNC